MITIKLNDQEYSLEQLILIHTEGAHQRLTPDTVLLNTEEAVVVATIKDYITVAGSQGLRVLVKPTDASKATGVYILSKYLLKKAALKTQYESTSVYQPRSYDDRRGNSYGRRNDRDGSRDNGRNGQYRQGGGGRERYHQSGQERG